MGADPPFRAARLRVPHPSLEGWDTMRSALLPSTLRTSHKEASIRRSLSNPGFSISGKARTLCSIATQPSETPKAGATSLMLVPARKPKVRQSPSLTLLHPSHKLKHSNHLRVSKLMADSIHIKLPDG